MRSACSPWPTSPKSSPSGQGCLPGSRCTHAAPQSALRTRPAPAQRSQQAAPLPGRAQRRPPRPPARQALRRLCATHLRRDPGDSRQTKTLRHCPCPPVSYPGRGPSGPAMFPNRGADGSCHPGKSPQHSACRTQPDSPPTSAPATPFLTVSTGLALPHVHHPPHLATCLSFSACNTPP